MDLGCTSSEPRSYEESEDEEPRSPPPPPLLPELPAVSAARGTPPPRSPSTASTTARLGLQFSGGPQPSSPNSTGTGSRALGLGWRDGRFSDWTVRLGERTYQLQAFLLARASLFFESHMSMAARTEQEGGGMTRGSDLTEVLPQSCHSVFEDALDFMYSENQAAFEAPASKALLLLKIADILGIGGLFDAMGRRIEAAFPATAPLLLEQYCRFHIPGTDDGAALRQIRECAMERVVHNFQPFLANPEMRTALLRLPAGVLAEILEAEDLLVANEDVVFDFVAARLEGGDAAASCAAAPDTCAPTPEPSAPVEVAADDEVLWQRVRWAHLSAGKFAQAQALAQRLMRPEVAMHALTARVARLDLGGAEAFASLGPQMGVASPRRPILPPGVPPPSSTEIDFCFHYTRDQYACGEAIRSQPRRIGDLVLRVLVFPAGTDTGVARGSLSVFLEAVPQAHWPRDWEFTNIRYAIACIRWPTGSGETWAAKKKGDLWTFKANRLDRGWHDFLAPGEIHRYLGPDEFVCIRGSLESECWGRTFLLSSQVTHTGYPGPGGEAAGSSASRRTWGSRGPSGGGPSE